MSRRLVSRSLCAKLADDGGDFLPFLIEYRGIIEAPLDRDGMLEALDRLGAHPVIVEKLGCDLTKSFVLTELQSLPGCGPMTAERLFAAGFRSVSDVQDATVGQLLQIHGIGQKTARLLIGNA